MTNTPEPVKPAEASALLPEGPARRPERVEVRAPSRLHFGLLSFGRPQGRQFGGVGMMIERPGLQLRIEPARQLQAVGLMPERTAGFARRWAEQHGWRDSPPCRIDVLAAPPEHVGLGLGTQLGLSVAAGLNAFFGLPCGTVAELTHSVGRGRRSAVGSYGFVEGGLIVERGRLPGEPLAPLDLRLDLPAAWRVVLLIPRQGRGLSGKTEQQAFDGLPAVPEEVTAQLVEELRERMLPAAARGQFAEFSESVYRYGRLAGMCFAAIQGGPYYGPRLTELVARVRELGVAGVGQSSWGPTLFALRPDEAAAAVFTAQLRADLPEEELKLVITPLNQTGVRIDTT